MKVKCVICIERFDANSHMSVCSCGHVFHTSCLHLWTRTSKTCPSCRAPVSERNMAKRLIFAESSSLSSASCSSSSSPSLHSTGVSKTALAAARTAEYKRQLAIALKQNQMLQVKTSAYKLARESDAIRRK